jgi:sarcosine oxidase subunit gamma
VTRINTHERSDDTGSVVFGEIRMARAWNVRGNPGHKPFCDGVEAVLALPLPVAPMTSAYGEHGALLGLGPRSWLYVEGLASPGLALDAARRAINAAGGALFDVSASYVGWAISGPMAERLLNRLCPLDFDRRAFPPGHCAQSLLGHIHALFHRPGETAAFFVMVARSFAADAWSGLCEAAAPDGYRVEAAVPFAADPTLA